MSRWPDDPYGKTLDDLDRKRTEVRNLKGKLRTERQKWEEERALWKRLAWLYEDCYLEPQIEDKVADLRRRLGLDDEPTTPPEEERDG